MFTRIAGSEMRKQFVPYLLTAINKYIDEHDDIADIDQQRDEILYYIILLTSVVRGNPQEVILIVDDIIEIIDKISIFKCKLTNKYSNAIIFNILSNVSTLQTPDVRSSPESFEKPLKEFLPIRHWGAKSDVNIKWYIPGAKAKIACEKIIHRYLPPILDEFEQYVLGNCELTRDDILRKSSTVLALLKCANLLPNWDKIEDPLDVPESTIIPSFRTNIILGFEENYIYMPDGSNVRLAVINTITKLQEKILQVYEDDIKSLKALILIWDRVHMRKQYSSPFDAQLKSFKNLKIFQDYNLTKKKKDIRAILATRILMQQDCRDEYSPPEFTQSHKTILDNLLKLSTSHYSAVRALAQSKLFTIINKYSFAYTYILDDIVNYLDLDSNEHHESFKGILYVIGGTRRGRLIVKNNWVTIEKLWLALLETNLSEKPSVVRLTDMIMEAIHNEFPTVCIEVDISDTCVETALALATNAKIVSAQDIALGKQLLNKKNSSNLAIYQNILSSILDLTQSNSLHWRYNLMASGMVYNLVHPDVKYPKEIIKYCLHNLINESIEERKLAIRTARYILKQQKHKHIKIEVNPFKIANMTESSIKTLKPGIRPDNKWLQYNLNKVPRSQAEWDEQRYVHKTEGFFGWSTGFSVYAPSDQQPKLDKDPAEMNDSERIIYEFFTNDSNVSKLIKFWSMEEKRGKEKFNRSRCFIIKRACDLFGEVITNKLLPHIEPLITTDKNLESSHRCAAEIMAGIMRGVKHWPYDKTEKLYTKLKPLICTALNNITVETDVFWGTCFATAAENFDPNKQWWLHEV